MKPVLIGLAAALALGFSPPVSAEAQVQDCHSGFKFVTPQDRLTIDGVQQAAGLGSGGGSTFFNVLFNDSRSWAYGGPEGRAQAIVSVKQVLGRPNPATAAESVTHPALLGFRRDTYDPCCHTARPTGNGTLVLYHHLQVDPASGNQSALSVHGTGETKTVAGFVANWLDCKDPPEGHVISLLWKVEGFVSGSVVVGQAVYQRTLTAELVLDVEGAEDVVTRRTQQKMRVNGLGEEKLTLDAPANLMTREFDPGYTFSSTALLIVAADAMNGNATFAPFAHSSVHWIPEKVSLTDVQEKEKVELP
jgi:hypothetical protein